MAEGVIHDFEMIEIDEQHGEGIFRVPSRALARMTQPLDEACPVGQSREAVVQGIVTELTLDPLRLHGAALQLDFGNRGGSDLAEMFDLVRGPVSRLDIYGDDHRQRFSGSAGNANAKKPGDA